MDIRKFSSRPPETCDIFDRDVLSEDESTPLQEACEAVNDARRAFEADTRVVQQTEKRIAKFVDTWRDVDSRLATMMDDVLLTGMEMNQVFKTGHMDEVQKARESLKALKNAYAEAGSKRLGEAVEEGSGAFRRREFMMEGLGDVRRDNVCPICMSKQLTTFMVPCGHVVCTYCATQVSDKCFICRGSVSSKNKLFFQ
jgi:hypothetical protein